MSDDDFLDFMEYFGDQFMHPDAERKFLHGWRSQLDAFAKDVLRFAIERTASDRRILHKQPQMFLPILLDYAAEETQRRAWAKEASFRREEYRAWQTARQGVVL